ncbi:DNA-damage-inducible protein D [compost metagenome]
MTSLNVQSKDLKKHNPIENEHIENSNAVRQMLLGRGIKPENLPADEDVKKVQRKLKVDSNNILKNTSKRNLKK